VGTSPQSRLVPNSSAQNLAPSLFFPHDLHRHLHHHLAQLHHYPRRRVSSLIKPPLEGQCKLPTHHTSCILPGPPSFPPGSRFFVPFTHTAHTTTQVPPATVRLRDISPAAARITCLSLPCLPWQTEKIGEAFGLDLSHKFSLLSTHFRVAQFSSHSTSKQPLAVVHCNEFPL
jgi:hypothetical protein